MFHNLVSYKAWFYLKEVMTCENLQVKWKCSTLSRPSSDHSLYASLLWRTIFFQKEKQIIQKTFDIWRIWTSNTQNHCVTFWYSRNFTKFGHFFSGINCVIILFLYTTLANIQDLRHRLINTICSPSSSSPSTLSLIYSILSSEVLPNGTNLRIPNACTRLLE